MWGPDSYPHSSWTSWPPSDSSQTPLISSGPSPSWRGSPWHWCRWGRTRWSLRTPGTCCWGKKDLKKWCRWKKISESQTCCWRKYFFNYILIKFGYSLRVIKCHHFNMEQYIPYSLIYDLFRRNLETYLSMLLMKKKNHKGLFGIKLKFTTDNC